MLRLQFMCSMIYWYSKFPKTCTQNQSIYFNSYFRWQKLICFFLLFQITFKYENDLLEELATKFFDYDEDCLPNGIANINSDSAVVNNIQAKLLRMENAYAKRVKIQGICYKKKLSDFQRTIMELNRQMQVSVCVITFSKFLFSVFSKWLILIRI